MSSELKKASVGPAFFGGIFIFLIFGLLLVIWFHLSGKAESFDDQRAVVRAAKLDQLQKDNHEKLTSYAWVNKGKGIVQLPIDRAMEIVVVDLKAKPVKASSVKLEVPYPAGLQQPPAASAPAPAATTVLGGTAAPASAASPAPATSASPAPATPAATPASSPAPVASPVPVPTATPPASSPEPSAALITPAP